MGKKRILPIVLFVGIALVIVPLICKAKQNKNLEEEKIENINISKNLWIDDINYFRDNLEKSHKDLYDFISKEEFYKKIDELKRDIPNIDSNKIFHRIENIVFCIGDGETKVDYVLEDEDIYPLKFRWFEDKLIVIEADKIYENLLGCELLAVNDFNLNNICELMKIDIINENEQWIKNYVADNITNDVALRHYNILNSEEKANFYFKDESNKKTIKEILEPTRKKEFKNKLISLKKINPNKEEISYNWKEKFYNYKYIEEESILYFQYNEGMDKETCKKAKDKNCDMYPNFKEFYIGMLNDIKKNNPEKIIIDLRNNKNGYPNLLSSFINEIKGFNEYANKENVFVIIGKDTGSCGILGALECKREIGAILVGEKTKMNVTKYVKNESFSLPNSKLKIIYPTEKNEKDHCIIDSLEPDIKVKQTLKDYLKDYDSSYNYIKNLKLKK